MAAVLHEFVDIHAGEKGCRALLCANEVERQKAEQPAEHGPRQNLAYRYCYRVSRRSKSSAGHVVSCPKRSRRGSVREFDLSTCGPIFRNARYRLRYGSAL